MLVSCWLAVTYVLSCHHFFRDEKACVSTKPIKTCKSNGECDVSGKGCDSLTGFVMSTVLFLFIRNGLILEASLTACLYSTCLILIHRGN